MRKDLDSIEKDVYQLATANSHILKNLVNVQCLHKLNEDEHEQYTGDFWAASSRLKLYDKHAQDQKALQDLDVELKKVTIANLEAQRLSKPAPLDGIAEIRSQMCQIER